MIKKISDAIETVRKNWPDSKYTMLIEALETLIEHAQIDAQEKETEKAFQLLQVYGVSKERAGSLSTGIDVLVTRLSKEIQSLKASRQMEIDTQAKTIRELWDIFSNIDIDEIVDDILRKMDKEKLYTTCDDTFAHVVAFFLAAGGRIKE